MSELIRFLTSETGLSVLGWLLGAGWTALQASKWWKGHSDARFRRALTCLEAGIQTTYETYVREMKAATADGKLTTEERKEARRRAAQAARDYAANQGIDLLAELGPELLDFYLEQALRVMKRKNMHPISMDEWMPGARERGKAAP